MKVKDKTKHLAKQLLPNFLLRPLLLRRSRRRHQSNVGRPASEIFTRYYEVNRWNSPESLSGPGSTLDDTRSVRENLLSLLRGRNVRSMLDAPCGDFNWMRTINLGECSYIGADIVAPMIAQNNTRYASEKVRFVQLDITKDPLPQVDLIFCRDCFMHLPFEMIAAALQNFKRSGAQWLLASNHRNRRINYDIVIGDVRPINLEIDPFFLPTPAQVLFDEKSATPDPRDEFLRTLSLWNLKDLSF